MKNQVLYLDNIEGFNKSDNTPEHKKRIFYKTSLFNSNFLT